MQTKTCSHCARSLSIKEFQLRRDSRDGYAYACKACQAEASAAYRARYASDPEWRAKRRAYNVEYHRRTWEDRREVRNLSRIRAKYGIEPAEYLALLAAHDGKCAICKGGPTRTDRLHVDHDHSSDKVRGLLCDSCNLGLGKFKDDPELLRAALAYLLR